MQKMQSCLIGGRVGVKDEKGGRCVLTREAIPFESRRDPR